MGRPFSLLVAGLTNQQPVLEVLGSAFVRSDGPALLFLPSLGATKVAPALLSSLRCDQLSLGTTELLPGSMGGFFWVNRRQGPQNTPAQVRVSPFLNDGLLASSPAPAWSSL
jgi:hypothetical protein